MGRNVSVLMPAPFSQMHDRLFRAHQIAGRAPTAIATPRLLVAMTAQREVIPVYICVTKISQVPPLASVP